MSYTVTDYYRDFTRDHLDWLTPEERLQDMSPDDVLKTLFPDETGEHVDTSKLERYPQQLRQKTSEA